MMKIILRDTNIHDAHLLLPLFSDYSNIKYTNFKQCTDLFRLEQFLSKFLSIHKNEPLQYGPYSIFANETIAGLCGIQQINLEKGIAEIWYILNKDYWGKGIAKNAIQQMLTLCSTNDQLHEIIAEAVTTNIASWKILEQFGFEKKKTIDKGFVKDDIIESLYCYSKIF